MKRIPTKDSSGSEDGWFDLDRASKIGSDRTGRSREWETLYRTAKGGYVLERASLYEGRRTTYQTLMPGEAVSWMITNGIDLPAECDKIAAATER